MIGDDGQKDVFDFSNIHRDPLKFLNCRDIRQLADVVDGGEVWVGPVYMSDKEVRESIVEDLLCFTMWEIQTGQKLDVSFDELVRFTTDDQKERIKREIDHEDIRYFVICDGNQLRIKNDKTVLQAAMDYCGCWYSGFEMPSEGVGSIDREALNDLIEQHGSLENLAGSMMMEMSCTTMPSKLIH